MWRRAIGGCALHQPWRTLSSKANSSGSGSSVASAVGSMLLRSLKEHYLEVSKMTPPLELDESMRDAFMAT